MSDFETISSDAMANVNGGSDFWDALSGAVNIVTSPISSTVRGVSSTIGALQQGHNLGDSLANGLVQAAGTMNAPNLANIPARP